MPNPAEKINLSLGLLRVAYNDYIAARVLLNKGYTLQGVMYASTAIEKYFKTVICLYTGSLLRGHMDIPNIFTKKIAEFGYGVIIEKIDPLFVGILQKGYKLRYYDNVLEVTTIGFFRNRFLGELDGAVALFEKLSVVSGAISENFTLCGVR